MHLHQPRLNQVEAGEEPGHLLPGAQGLRRGDALVVDPLRVRLSVMDVDRGMRDRQIAAGRQGGHQPGHDPPRVLDVLYQVQHPEQHERHRLAEVQEGRGLVQDRPGITQVRLQCATLVSRPARRLPGTLDPLSASAMAHPFWDLLWVRYGWAPHSRGSPAAPDTSYAAAHPRPRRTGPARTQGRTKCARGCITAGRTRSGFAEERLRPDAGAGYPAGSGSSRPGSRGYQTPRLKEARDVVRAI